MKGFVPTPPELVDRMVAKLFSTGVPMLGATLLDPGCGGGVFVAGVIRWCHEHGAPLPRITAVDSDPARLREAEAALGRVDGLTLRQQDFLSASGERFDYIIGNPPYVAITGLDPEERARYRRQYRTATGRFDLYQLFFEQALSLLKPDGRLLFVTPEKFLYVKAAAALRQELALAGVEEIELIAESSFPGLVTYPAVTTVARTARGGGTRIALREGTVREVSLDGTGESWMYAVNGAEKSESRHTLVDAFSRISCGVATGADGIFVLRRDRVPTELREFAHPTLAGRDLEIGTDPDPRDMMLIPYSRDGVLLPENRLGQLKGFLSDPERRTQLEGRSCTTRKPWYAFHETPPLADIRRPKILCKDIGRRPWFVVDESGEIVPRHSLYYLVPTDGERIHELCDYLNSPAVSEFLMANCQRAANGFVRLQSHVLKNVPLPEHFVVERELVLE